MKTIALSIFIFIPSMMGIAAVERVLIRTWTLSDYATAGAFVFVIILVLSTLSRRKNFLFKSARERD
jgi:hypothetical protein